MKNLLLIISIFFAVDLCSIKVYAQSVNKEFYLNIPDLTVADSINLNEIDSAFGFSSGTHSYGIRLFSNMTYKSMESDCQLSIELERGTYSIVGKQLILKAENKKLVFDIFLFAKCYFFILPSQRTSFISDLKKFQVNYIGKFPRAGSKISANDMIAFRLCRKYYSNKRRLPAHNMGLPQTGQDKLSSAFCRYQSPAMGLTV